MVIQKLIYLDTNLSNRLLDQNVDPSALLSKLKRCDSSLALSGQNVYELALTFQNSVERGMELFRYLKVYVDAGIVGAYDNLDLLRADVHALYARADSVVAYYSPADYDALKTEVAKLAEGIVDQRAQSFLSKRKGLAKAGREEPKTHLEQRPDMKARLLAVPENELVVWLDEQMSGRSAPHFSSGISLTYTGQPRRMQQRVRHKDYSNIRPLAQRSPWFGRTCIYTGAVPAEAQIRGTCRMTCTMF